MRKFLGLAVGALILSTMAVASPNIAVLDGTSWKINVEPDFGPRTRGKSSSARL